MEKRKSLPIAKIIFIILLTLGALSIIAGCILLIVLSVNNLNDILLPVLAITLGSGGALIIISSWQLSRINLQEGNDANFAITCSGVNMYKIFGNKSSQHIPKMEEYFNQNTDLSLETFKNITVFKAELDNLKQNMVSLPYFSGLYNIIGDEPHYNKTALLSQFYGVAIRLMSGIYKNTLFNCDIFSTSPLLGENIAVFKNAVNCGKLSIDNRILLFYFAYHNKLFKEEALVRAYNEFVDVYTEQGDTLERSSIITAKFAANNSDFKPINPLFSIYHLELMSESELDSFIENMFIGLGYTTIHTISTDNSPIDFIIEKDGSKLSVMAKSYGLVFDEKQMNALANEIAKCNTERGILITTNAINSDAVLLAKKFGIEIYSMDKLEKLISGLKRVNKNKC